MSDEQSAAARAFARQRAAMMTPSLSPPAKVVLIVLATMANERDQAWPPIRGATGLAFRCSLGERTVARGLRELEAAGHVTRVEVPGKGSIYTVHPCQSGSPAPAAVLPERQATPARAATKQPGTTIERKKTTSSPSTRERAASVQRMAPAPTATLTSVLDLPALPSGASEQQWADYVEMRVAMGRADKKRAWTPTVARKAIEKLHALASAGNDPGAVLDQSVLNTWQGLFPVKDDQHGQRGDQPGRGGGTGYGRNRPVDGFTAALREAQARFGPDDDRGG